MSEARRDPVIRVAELETLDPAEQLEGYLDGYRGEPEPGDNRSRAYWHGWRNGAVDGGHRQIDYAQRVLAHQVAAKATPAPPPQSSDGESR